MRKLLFIIFVLFLGLTLSSCGETIDPIDDDQTPIENTSLVSDLIDSIKGVFGD